MGRFEKIIFNEDGVDRRESGYYSTPPFIAKIIFDLLTGLNPSGRKVLDPCVGKEELIQDFLENGYSVDSFDVNRFPDRFESNFIQLDFLKRCIALKSEATQARTTKAESRHDSIAASDHDFIVMNPPYNCHEANYIKENKELFQAAFQDIGVYNLYALFISAVIDSAKEGALIGVIASDSFLTSRFHKELRRKIVESCAIHHLLLCPTDLFMSQQADVRTCIMVLQKGAGHQGEIRTLNRSGAAEAFCAKVERGSFEIVSRDELILGHASDGQEFTIGIPPDIRRLFGHPRLGESFPCITGISTGNDRKYLSDIETETHSIPFYKNPATRRFFCEPDGYLIDDWADAENANRTFIVRNKSLLFKSGIACSSMGVAFGACYRPEKCLFGVNANIICEDEDAWWLLAYLNSSLVSYLVRGVLIRSNMITSGYVARLPLLPIRASGKTQLAILSKQAYAARVANEPIQDELRRIDAILYAESHISKASVDFIDEFRRDILKRT